MIPALMLVFSGAALVQFFMSYCRSLLVTYSQVELSTATRHLIGIQSPEIAGTEFRRLLKLVRLAPNPGDDKWELRAISIYYGLLKLTRCATKPLGAVAQKWFERRAGLCAHFAAAALERRTALAAAG